MSFDKVLIANRGEIALRVLRTCREMGLGVVAVYSDADAGAPHVEAADEAVRLGPAPASESYLKMDAIIEAARRTGAGAIHPGYGFLAENAEFADAVAAAGLTFIGPSADVIRAMGDKASARELMSSQGVPVAPGYAGSDQSDENLISEANRIGYPVLVKAVAGGGGKGMSIVESEAEMADALAQARRLAASAFGDDTLLLESYIRSPRHIEVQIIGDEHGQVRHCFERECSVQRRFQKIIEEAPSVAVDEVLRDRLTQAAITAGETLGYVGAGTVEFIMSPKGDFYFLEVNTRLQVEHPVTELVTGLDLVSLQIQVAQGKPLPAQESIQLRGHAVECRLYAEDPANEFLPQTGTVLEWSVPKGPSLRIDAGVQTGTVVGIHYDPMLAKIIAYGSDRPEATQRLAGALRSLGVTGVTTNRAFLVDVLENPVYCSGDISTHFIAEHMPDWRPSATRESTERRLVAAALYRAERRGQARGSLQSVRPGWRNNPPEPVLDTWQVDDHEQTVGLRYVRDDQGGYRVTLSSDGSDELRELEALVRSSTTGEIILCGGPAGDAHPVQSRFHIVEHNDEIFVRDRNGENRFVETDRFPAHEAELDAGGCVAPMPGRVVSVLVEVGQAVEAGAGLVILEAMKMEQTLSSGQPGTVKAIHCAPDEIVEAGVVLVDVEPIDEADA